MQYIYIIVITLFVIAFFIFSDPIKRNIRMFRKEFLNKIQKAWTWDQLMSLKKEIESVEDFSLKYEKKKMLKIIEHKLELLKNIEKHS